jgi:hypothetical protein
MALLAMLWSVVGLTVRCAWEACKWIGGRAHEGTGR